ncbi:MAG: SDR family NAD(P)-dependent oxidoreductase [Christensenellales bacterium]|jgi:NAD(P)-dependent dehydrogenase (short-subunit alcohol dehydrogenase family)
MIALDNKVAVVTGGGGALGSAICRGLAKAGCRIAILGRTFETINKVACDINTKGDMAIAVPCDVTSMDDLSAAEQIIREKYGYYNILINGAGGAPASACTKNEMAEFEDADSNDKNVFFNLSNEAVEEVMHTNFMSAFSASKVFSKGMMNEKGALILNICSMSGILPLTKQIAYSASKAAVANYTMWLAKHLASVGIRVNAIAPGFFATNINRHLLYDEKGNPSLRTKKILEGTPMGRLGNPEELVGTVLYLCDERLSGFVTGVVIPVDGGFSCYCGV